MSAVPSQLAEKPIPPEVVAMAGQAVKDFHECFWFRHPEAEITEWKDVALVIDRLRRYGGHRAWHRSPSSPRMPLTPFQQDVLKLIARTKAILPAVCCSMPPGSPPATATL
jgi:hypothetical protein